MDEVFFVRQAGLKLFFHDTLFKTAQKRVSSCVLAGPLTAASLNPGREWAVPQLDGLLAASITGAATSLFQLCRDCDYAAGLHSQRKSKILMENFLED